MTPAQIHQAIQAALANQRAGKIAQAEELCRGVLAARPDSADALHLLGTLNAQRGQMDAAIELIQRAIAISPIVPDYHSNLALILHQTGRADEAIAAAQQAVKLKPDFAAAHFNLARWLHEESRLDEALAAYRQATRFDPRHVLAHNNLGIALREKGLFDQAIASFRQALSLRPDLAEIQNNLANALRDNGSPHEAIDLYHRALALRPDLAVTHNNLGIAFYNTCQPDQAIAAYRQALQLAPDYAEVHHNLATAFLIKGDFNHGLPEYEWRWRWKGMAPQRPEYSKPRCEAAAFNGKTILLHFEAGFGDTIQFVRYAPMVAARGARVILDCQPELIRLLRTLPGIDQLVPAGAPLPPFDERCGLLSLPLVFGTTLESIPAPIPYLKPDPELTAKWADRLPPSGELKVGIVWAGNPIHTKDRTRSLRLSMLAPLAKVPRIQFYNLQKGPSAAQLTDSPHPLHLIDFAPELTDFADTAALIANLDLVIASDTAVAHLAGAIGKPLWLLLPFAPDWRWLLNRDDTPWYPTMRLFRQSTLGDWPGVMERVAQALRDAGKES
ncbi:MAG: tetratricopeptide repeat protein [Tepidisphaeraceae bacterium]